MSRTKKPEKLEKARQIGKNLLIDFFENFNSEHEKNVVISKFENSTITARGHKSLKAVLINLEEMHMNYFDEISDYFDFPFLLFDVVIKLDVDNSLLIYIEIDINELDECLKKVSDDTDIENVKKIISVNEKRDKKKYFMISLFTIVVFLILYFLPNLMF